MKVILYLLLITLSVIIVYLTNIMQYRPFDSNDMYIAYNGGCNIASPPVTVKSAVKCEELARIYKDFLDNHL